MKWGTPTGLNRDPVSRLHGSKNFAAKRSLYSVCSVTSRQWRDLRMGVI